MTPPLLLALAIIGFAALFHLHWALGGSIGYSVSLPQRPDGKPVMVHRLAWWRPAAAGVALALAVLAVLALSVAGLASLPLDRGLQRLVLGLVGAVFCLRALAPARYTGFFKTVRTTRWARYDTRLYSPLFLALGAALIFIAI